MIRVSDGARPDLKIILDGLNFLNSYWKLYGVNVEIINCNAASLVLELNHLKHVIIHNCTFGNWTFSKVQNAFIKNCNNVFDEDVSTSLKFYNSSGNIDNMTMNHEVITGNLNGILIYNYSMLHVKQSKFVNNTVEHGIIKTLESSSLIMSKCTVVGNHATEYPGVIYANESVVHLKNTYFNNNTAIIGGGAIFIVNMSFLQIKNCIFKNNSVDGVGGAILSINYSLIDLSYSIFDHNKALLGGAIHQETGSKTKLNQCSFYGNLETAVSGLYGSKISIMNSAFQNNLSKNKGGAVAMIRSALYVFNTTFENNKQISPPTYVNPPVNIDGGGVINLYKSVGSISKSKFHNNSATYCGGSIAAFNSSLSIRDTEFQNNVAGLYGGAVTIDFSSVNIESSNFENNSVSNKVIGKGGGVCLYSNSKIEISNVLFSKCHASSGGAISSQTTSIILSNSFVIANTGSAIDLSNGDNLEINNNTFSNNSTPQHGGAIICRLNGIVKIVNTTFSQNAAITGGGAVYIERTILSVYNCSFNDNTAYGGGAINPMFSDCTISDSVFSHNTAIQGGAVAYQGHLVMTNCCINNNTAHANGGVIHTTNASLLMSNCLVFNNFANTFGGVFSVISSEIVITTSIFKMNRAYGAGGVFYVTGGRMLLKNSSFAKNIATVSGGVVQSMQRAVINITESFCFENQGGYYAGVLMVNTYTKILISDTKINQNTAHRCGALSIDSNSVLELYGSQVENNNAEIMVGALCISNGSLLVASNSSFRGNKAYQDSSLRIVNSTAYLEKCIFMENRMPSYGGTVSNIPKTKLKISDTNFTENDGYDILYYVDNGNFINKFETHRCAFMHGNISLGSNMKNFEEVAVNEKFIGPVSLPQPQLV